MKYAGFWRRFGAYWIDGIVMLPLIGIAYFFDGRTRLFHFYWLLPGEALGIWYSVYLVAIHGGTPGKLLLNTKIVMLDGSPITFKAATIRYSVLFGLSLASSVGMAMACLAMTDDQYFSLNYFNRNVVLMRLTPSWYRTVSILSQVWIWSEFITMMFNKKRRAIHDFIAGTVVVDTSELMPNHDSYKVSGESLSAIMSGAPPDYSKYSEEKLRQVLTRIDKERFPDRVLEIEARLMKFPNKSACL
jgi:uncharacterized RDD family membrane protein YckC